jgi:hypothetical protein
LTVRRSATEKETPQAWGKEGLFSECMVRANVALGLSADGPYKIMPDVASTDIQTSSGKNTEYNEQLTFFQKNEPSVEDREDRC